MKQRAYNLLGNTAVANFPHGTKREDKVRFAKELLKKNKTIKTVLEKSGKFSGRLRKPKTKFLAGIKTKEVLYKENNCVFRFNIDATYFSPRLSNERKEIAEKIKRNDEVFVAFAGVGPVPIVLAKNSKAKRIYSNELNRKANEYQKENLIRNKVVEKIELVPGDFKKVVVKLNKKFDVVVMPRPQLKDTFLKEAFLISKRKTRIYYYDFCGVEEIEKVVAKIKSEAKKSKRKIKILNLKNAGEIAPYKIRIRVDFEVKNNGK